MGTVFRFYPTVLGEGDVDGARIGGQSTVELNYLGTYETNREVGGSGLSDIGFCYWFEVVPKKCTI